MASLRGGEYLWNAQASITNSGNAAKSKWALVGDVPYVAVYITCNQIATFKVQVSATPSPQAGLNAITSSDTVDGGLTWYDLTGFTTVTVAVNTPLAVDLSPFAPQFLRLVRTDGGTSATVTAFVSAFGPN